MTTVWKRLQRVGKRAAKYQFTISYHEIMVECTEKWQPHKLCVVFHRRGRRYCTRLQSWRPTIQNAFKGLVVWSVPENIDVNITLFKDVRQPEFEDKEWTFVIEDFEMKMGFAHR